MTKQSVTGASRPSMAALKPPLKKNLKLEPFQNIDLIRYTLSETFGPGTETPEQFWAEIEIMEVFKKTL